MAKINDNELIELAELYNSEGRTSMYSRLQEQYGIKTPYSVLLRMKNKAVLGYDHDRDYFNIANDPGKDDDVFMSIEELCSPMVTQHVKPAPEALTSKPEAMDKLVRELIGDRLLELSRYVMLDPLMKTITIDQTSLLNDGYQLVTH
jgi:hypothetical protein